MNETERHIGTLNQMQSQYSHIRHNDNEFLALEASKEALREKLERAEFYEKCIGERYAEYHKINIGQEQEIFKLERQLAAAEKERDAVIEDFESAAHTGNDFCEFCGADCVDAGNDYIKDTCQCGMFVYRGGQGEKGEEGCMK